MLNPPTLWAAPIPNPEGVVLIFCNPLTPRPGNPQSEGSPQGDSGTIFHSRCALVQSARFHAISRSLPRWNSQSPFDIGYLIISGRAGLPPSGRYFKGAMELLQRAEEMDFLDLYCGQVPPSV